MKNREEIEDDYDFYETFDEEDNGNVGLDYNTFKERYVDNKPEEEKDVSINATLESKTNLKWQKEIDIHRHFDTTIILEGNVNDKQIYIGAFGKVYANTWQTIELKEQTNNREESEIYSYFVNKARYLIAKEFTSDEKIENEMILNFNYNNDNSSIKIHYTLLENIAFLKK